MKKISVINFVLASMMLVSFASCCKKPYVDITYELECSGELLDCATPKVTHTDNSKRSVNIALSKDDFEYNEATNKYVWKYEVPRYEDFNSVDDEMHVTYEAKSGVSIDKASVDLTHFLDVSYEMRDDDKNTNSGRFASHTSASVYVNGNRVTEDISKMSDYRKCHFESTGNVKIQ